MTKTEIKERLEKLEYQRFLVDMIDRWLPKDWEEAHKLDVEIHELKKLLKD